MSNKIIDLEKARHNRKVLILLPLSVIVMLCAYFLYSTYSLHVSSVQGRELQKLSAVVNSLAVMIDGDEYAALMDRYPQKDALTTSGQEPVYHKYQQLLARAKEANGLKTDIYTLSLVNQDYQNRPAEAFQFGLTSAEVPYFRHSYRQPPEKLFREYQVGAEIEAYKTERGTWVSAFAPIRTRAGEVVGVVEADNSLDVIYAQVWNRTLRNGVVLFILCLLVTLVLYTVIGAITQSIVRGQQRFDEEFERLSKAYGSLRAFTSQIQRGNLDAEIEGLDRKDILGESLIAMRDSLRVASQKEQERSWILSGVSKTAVVLNAHTNIHSLAEEIIPMLCDQIGAIQGAFFNVVDDDEIPAMEMIHSYAYGRKKHLARLFRFGEGLVGQAALEKDIIYRSELPENYVTMTSGILGDRKPGYLVIVPLITNDTVYGALEFAGFDPFSPLIRKFLQQVSENIAGTLLNLRAIHNERMRGQMQALSENSPDLITRFDAVGKIYYVNPVIEEITGAGPDQYLQKNLMDISIDPNIVDQWRAIIRDVIMTGDKQKREMIVPGLEGERVMDVKAIPEYNGSDNGSPESVLVVSHDITEMKRIEAEVRDKNKKITQSINYAKRIQNSIILHDELLGNLFPDSFIYYKPKDVVSGDFPWLLQRDDCTYLAAVDCTGHGVPGAMMSLIGYFLLNEIAGHQELLSPAEMLNRLHQSVRDTLKQDSGKAEARDGMDIALCRIDNDGKTIQFAGAHRPLYQVRHGRLTQYKGDRKAIGGATIRKIQEKPFTNHVIETQPGDAFYLFSDGLPDQLGGPSSMKFSPARVRDLVSVNGTHTMEDIQVNIESAYNDWLGDGKQLDDVLMIGLKIS